MSEPTYTSGPFIPPGYSVIGTCSICGGPVIVPTMWMGVIPPVPTCAQCGAVMQRYGGTIPMRSPESDEYEPGCPYRKWEKFRSPTDTEPRWTYAPTYTDHT